jgi:hypothetical protein
MNNFDILKIISVKELNEMIKAPKPTTKQIFNYLKYK